jgi:hypothetical protein
MGAEPPECGARFRAQLSDFQCIECGRKTEGYESAWFSGRRICSECHRRELERRCARCFRRLESWQGRVLDGNEYCELCFLLMSERSANGRGTWGGQFN